MVINDLIIKNAFNTAITVYGDTTTNNVEFSNCYSNEGSTVYVYLFSYTSKNDRFINNFAADIGVIYSLDATVTFDNGQFINNSAAEGGVIYSSDSNLTVNNGFFNGNSASRGAAVSAIRSNVVIADSLMKNHNSNWSSVAVVYSNATVSNTIFANSTSKYATAIFGMFGNTTIVNSSFIDLFADDTAGALGFKESNDIAIDGCEFINSSSSKNAGAIFIDIRANYPGNEGTVVINNTRFVECSSEFGGAYLQLFGNLSISNSDFTGNGANYNGGAVYISDVIATISNCTFAENDVDWDDSNCGGALFLDNSNVTLCNSQFSKNSAGLGSALYMYDGEYRLANLEFNGNDNAVYMLFSNGSRINITGTDSISDDDFNNTVYYDVIAGRGMQLEFLNNTINITSLLDRYDLREENLVTPVKDQGFMGACWAFGALAALESNMLKAMNYTADFSENNMQNSMLLYSRFGKYNIAEGGDNLYSMGYLVSWLGAFPKDYDSYDELGKISPLMYTDEDIHVHDVVILPYTSGDKDSIDNIKWGILKYGALTCSILSQATKSEGIPTGYYNENTSAQYVPESLQANHVVCLVGWIDNFSASNFAITPPGDGAWIVKNSWGTDWGDEGYFYVSYYDRTFSGNPESISDSFMAFNFENTNQYDRNYQYDFSGLTGFYDIGTPVTYVNIFTAYENELIAAAGTYFEEGAEYKIDIDVNGEDVYTQSGVSSFYGYHTIELDEHVPIKKGDNFSISVTSDRVPICQYSRVHVKNMTSVLIQGTDYEDLSSQGIVACLKAYTINDERHSTALITPDRVIGVNDAIGGYDYRFILKDENGSALANMEVHVSIGGENQTVTTDEKGWGTATVTANTEGSYDVEITFDGDSDYAGVSQSGTVKVVRQKTSFVAPDRVVYVRDMSAGYTYSAILKDNYGNVLANKKVLFIFDGEKIVTFTDEKGWASVTLKAVNAGTQTVTIKFAGDRCYQETTATRTIKIVRESSKMTVESKAYESADLNKKITATLKSKSDRPVYGAKVTLSVSGKTYIATTDDNGIAIFSIDLSQIGVFDAVAKFAESRFYAATSVTSKIFIY